MNEQQQLAQLIRDIQAEGDVGAQALAQALMAHGVRLSAQPDLIDEERRLERVQQMLTYAESVMRRQPGNPVNLAFEAASAETQRSFLAHLQGRLIQNPFFYLGMQTTGELVRAVADVPELHAAYSGMTPEERAAWLSSVRDAWHDFAQAAEALGVPRLP